MQPLNPVHYQGSDIEHDHEPATGNTFAMPFLTQSTWSNSGQRKYGKFMEHYEQFRLVPLAWVLFFTFGGLVAEFFDRAIMILVQGARYISLRSAAPALAELYECQASRTLHLTAN